MNKEDLFLNGKISKTVLKLSIPLVLSQLINVLYNIVDRIYIGNMKDIGETALAGVGISFPIILIVSAFAALVGFGGGPIFSIKLGEGKHDEAKNTMMNSFVMLVIVGVILTFALLIFSEPLLYLFGATDEIITYAKDYLNIYALGTVSVMLTLGLSSYITGQGNSIVAMIVVIIGAVANIILDPIFMFAFNMGVKGAALATIVSQTLSAIYAICFLLSKKSIVKLDFNFKKFKFNKKIVLSILALGVSPFIMQATESAVQIVFNIQITKFGGTDYKTYLNLMTIMLSIMQFIMLPIMGFAQGASPLISYNYGAKRIDRVKSTFKFLITISVAYSFIFYLFLLITPTTFVSIFNNEPKLLSIAPNILRIFFLGMSIMGIQIACQNTFMALGQSLISLILASLRKIILLIPLTLILPNFYGINGVFYAEPIADIIAVIITLITFILLFNRILKRKINESVY